MVLHPTRTAKLSISSLVCGQSTSIHMVVFDSRQKAVEKYGQNSPADCKGLLAVNHEAPFAGELQLCIFLKPENPVLWTGIQPSFT
ncbi:hypothetical protein Ppro_1204 [Pelobacter propionicus DSM 2379]|uniref:Uncharacterized protein n=1 Tax=Pelobacter propionicus (strain DSM 2379 / NBRC 103807 / OttBd1) TaxID=338966 RepID=A1ANA5_PELPD|nr:hypothetical protein Ppro_1204 [Pelobacter propionicus DSM 2379]